MFPLRSYLSVHDFYDNDRKFPGYLRAMVHNSASLAALWEFVRISGKTVLRIKANRASAAVGWYLTEVSDGFQPDVYLAVTPDLDLAMPITAVPLRNQ